MHTVKSRFILRAGCALLFAISSLFGAETTGTVQGTVTDSSGAVLPGVSIALTNKATGLRTIQKSNAAGLYIFNLVPPGTYDVTGTLDGFRASTQSGLEVAINTTVRADLTMAVGGVTESIEVVAETARVDTESAQVTNSVSEKMITELPVSSRNTLQLGELIPGVEMANTASQVTANEGTYANVNGNRRGRNVFYLDGSDNTGAFRNSALQFPNPESVQEMSVTSSTSSAEFGKQPGGVFNVITKSGTNQFHGSGFYFMRNEAFDANTFNRNQNKLPTAPNRLKQGGGTLGGPVRKNKTFFFSSVQLYRDNSNSIVNGTIFPTKAALNGDFSAFNRPLYDPDTGIAIPGNIIPASLMDPVAKKLLAMYPTVDNWGQHYIWSYQKPIGTQEVLGKIDHSWNDKHRSSFSFFRVWGTSKIPDGTSGQSNDVPAWGPLDNTTAQNTLSGRHTWVMTPNWLFEGKFAMAGLRVQRVTETPAQNLSDFGAKFPNVQEGARKYLPNLNISNGPAANIGAANSVTQKNVRFGGTVSWIHGAHNVRFGGETQRDAVVQFNDAGQTAMTFDGRSSSTTGGKITGSGVYGYALADAVMGRAASFTLNGILNYNLHNWSDFFFIQDNWKVSRRLTLTPGLRYELYTPASEANRRAVAFVRGFQSSLYPNAPRNLAFAGDPGIPNGFVNQDYNNVAPRMGGSYDLTGKGRTVIRGGAGLYYSFNPTQIRMWNAEAPPWRPNAAGGETRGLTDIFGTSRTVTYTQPPTPFSSDVSNFKYPAQMNNSVGFDPAFQTPYSIQWNLTLEHEVARGFVLSAGYVGNRSFHLLQMLPGNLPVQTATASLSNIDARRPVQGFGNVGIDNARARGWYDGLQLTGRVRLAKGFTARGFYTYSKNFEINGDDPTSNGNIQTSNPFNLDSDKALTNRLHSARIALVYNLPFFANTKRLTGKLLGGWILSGTVSFSSGAPLDPNLGEDYNYDSIGSDRPIVTGPIQYTEGTKDERAAQYFSKSTFIAPPTRTMYSTSGRNLIWGPGTRNSDMAMMKTFRVSERFRTQLRMEAYNWMNHNNLGNPNLNMKNADFGRIINRNGNRTMQASLRLFF